MSEGDGKREFLDETLASLEQAIERLRSECTPELKAGLRAQLRPQALLSDELQKLETKLVAGRPAGLSRIVERALDLVLEYGAAECIIGDLTEQYSRRLARDPKFAPWWLAVQFAWIAYGRALEVVSRFVKARAGG